VSEKIKLVGTLAARHRSHLPVSSRSWGRHFWARGYFCVTSGDVTEEMIKNYLDHHFKPKGEITLGRSKADVSLTRIRTLVLYTNPPALAGGC
jgi:hypothetical protein